MSGIYKYPKELDKYDNEGGLSSEFKQDYNACVHFTLYKRSDAVNTEIQSEIYLYMPNNVESPMSVSWDNAPIGRTGEGVGGFFSTLGTTAITQAEAFLEGSLALGQGVSGEDRRSYYAQNILNPHIKMLFRGLGFRTFEMSFKFTPRNVSESQEIKDIINEFRTCATPTELGTQYMGFPSIVSVQYEANGKHNEWLPKYKPCNITDLHVNYTSAGHYAAMRDGFPAETELRMTFSETSLLSREDIQEGY